MPEGLHGGLVRFILLGILPGDFLKAVLKNDLSGAMRRADMVSRAKLYEIVTFLHNHAPGSCWGNSDAMLGWHKRGGLLLLGDEDEKP